MWHEYPLEEASWVLEKDFSDQRQLQIDLEKDNPPEEKWSNAEDDIILGGSCSDLGSRLVL